MLLRCSEKKDISEWNQWRLNNDSVEILLEGANLNLADLRAAQLAGARLKGAMLHRAILKGANLHKADLQGAYVAEARLRGATLEGADLTGARLRDAKLQGAVLAGADLRNAKAQGANLQGSYLRGADLRGAVIAGADLRGARLIESRLEGAKCGMAVVDGSTIFVNCAVDRKTDFRGVGLGNARIEPGLKQLLESNARRINWEHWYEEHRFVKWLVRPFWWMSDYGGSTGRIIAVFFGLAILFAAIYWIWGLLDHPGIVQNLLIDRNGVEVPSALVPFRALYFSVVTMTTLGFGDMHAYAASFWGHLLLMVQVLLGYVLLAALVTRFAILFTAGGPAGKFSKPEKKPNRGDRGESK
jgi:hypothetical protein